CDHDGPVRRGLDRGAQHLAGEAGRRAPETRAPSTALGIVVVREERLALLAGCARFERPRFAQSPVRELDARAPPALAEDLGGGLPEGAGLFGFAGLCQQTPNGVENLLQFRREEESYQDVEHTSCTKTSRNYLLCD